MCIVRAGDPDNFLAPNFGRAGIASGSNTSRWRRKDVDALLSQARETTARVTGMKVSPFSLNNYSQVDLK